MYIVERSESEIFVKGPDNFLKVLNPNSIGIVIKASLNWYHEEPIEYTVMVSDMTDAEIVGQVLGIEAYPQ